MQAIERALVLAALDGKAWASQTLTSAIQPVVRVRVTRWMKQLGPARCAKLGFESLDLVQEILATLYERDGRLLRLWDPVRGLSLRNWVGLVTRRLLAKQLARAKTLRFQHEAPSEIDTVPSPCDPLEARDELSHLLRRLEARVSPQALVILVGTCLAEDVSVIAERAGTSEQAVYAARLRLTRLARELRTNADATQDDAIPRPSPARSSSGPASRST